jgi:ribosome-binding factor A
MIPAKKPYARKQRVSELILAELGKIILREVEIPLGTIATIVEVDVTDKLDYARIHVSVIPSARADEALKSLNSRLPYLQHLLQRQIEIRPMPQLSFEVDRGVERAAAIEKALLDEEAKNH